MVDDFAPEPAPLDPPQVHAHEHLGPVLRLRSAGAGMNCDNGIRAVMVTAEHLLNLAAVDEARELVDPLRHVGQDVFTLACPIDEDRQVVGFGFQGIDELDFLLDAAAALENLLSFGLVAPEIRGRGARFDAG
jgi:hypothetical protein